MFVKWIVCCVDNDRRSVFHQAQCGWQGIRGSIGLIGQVGGWAVSSGEACVLGLWEDNASYNQFMAKVHDDVVRETAQAQTYRSCGVVLANSLFGMAGEATTLTEAMAIASVLRIADCEVLPDRRDHFIDVQRAVWEPAMAAAPGQLGGHVSCEIDDPSRFLVTTFWRDESCHDAYVRECVPRLRSAADVTVDLSRVVGRVVRLESDWCVMPNRRVQK